MPNTIILVQKHPGPLPPSFACDHFYCESGVTSSIGQTVYYTSDSVWNGRSCSSENSCCSKPNQLWFYQQLLLTSSDNIEVRICYDEEFGHEGVLVKELQLYVRCSSSRTLLRVLNSNYLYVYVTSTVYTSY